MLAPIALICIWLGGAPFTVLVGLITIGLAYEWLALCREPISPASVAIFAALPAGVACVAGGFPLAALSLLLIATAVACANKGLSLAQPVAFGLPYLGFGAIALVWLRQAPDAGRTNVIVLLLLVWASDIGAYVVGRAVGGRKLAPAISPGKTVSGAIGGLFAAAIVGAGAAGIIGAGVGTAAGTQGVSWRAVLFAAAIAAISQAGDLFESLLKRHFGVKDSGRLIPGHGGLLDRLDALLTAAPAAGLLALLLGRGVVIWQ